MKSRILVGSGSSPAAVLADRSPETPYSDCIAVNVMGPDVGNGIVEVFIALRGLARAKKLCAKFLET
jgi:hypothetical protein